MKKIILLLVLIQSVFLIAQPIKAITKDITKYEFIAKNLKAMNNAEMLEYQATITGNVKMYDVQGASIAMSQLNDLMTSPNFTPVMFADKKFNIKAIVFRAATEEEKAIKTASLALINPNANFQKGQFASNFIAEDMDGTKVSLKELRGKVVVLTFWSTTHKTSVKILHTLNELVRKHKDVVFLAITFDDYNTVKKFLKHNEFTYAHIVKNEQIIADNNISLFPTHLILDQKGEIIFKKAGDVVKELDTKLTLTVKGF